VLRNVEALELLLKRNPQGDECDAARLCAIVTNPFFLRTMPAWNSAKPDIVIIGTSAVATIIHAVSAALTVDVSAKAGVASETIVAKAAQPASRHDTKVPPWYFPSRS
jgi:hypothetical protein